MGMMDKAKELAWSYLQSLRAQKREREAQCFELELGCLGSRGWTKDRVEELIRRFDLGLAL